MPNNKIAVVEDEGIVAMDISKCLTSLGYEVVFVSDSGEKVIELMKESTPDLILMDVELKGQLNGLDTARIIKEKYDVRVVFLTAFEDETTLNRIGELSPDGYLVKPFEDEQLEGTLKRVLN
ncbi:MAG TPA: response regulator [Ignavibacteria bacterium]|nr:response regulator [Ignavibacteria bacterium]HRF66616.1 response regulator [Ignavibacteria bacterium]HRJ04470.1 response regulator [Ignavibacteria bacterium]HRJ86639.1 response regulator [Ignavibacteria bacterium]